MEIFVEMEDGSPKLLEVDTVYRVKTKIYQAQAYGIDPRFHMLSFEGLVLKDSKTLMQYGIPKGSILKLLNH